MRQHLGEEMTGLVTGVTDFGIYVMLPNTVEGMISIRDMSEDKLWNNDHNVRLVQENGSSVYQLGDTVKVICTKTDISSGNIVFSWWKNPKEHRHVSRIDHGRFPWYWCCHCKTVCTAGQHGLHHLLPVTGGRPLLYRNNTVCIPLLLTSGIQMHRKNWQKPFYSKRELWTFWSIMQPFPLSICFNAFRQQNGRIDIR